MPRARRQPKRPTTERLANAALYYLSRYAASEASLRRVLQNKIRRYAMTDVSFAADVQIQAQLSEAIEQIVEQHKRLGVLNDKAFAEMKVSSLRRAGKSARRIREKLTQKGVKSEVIDVALAPEEGMDAREMDVDAAHSLARRRGLGPYRKGGISDDPKQKVREVSILARAGFSFDVIKQVLGSLPEEGEPVF